MFVSYPRGTLRVGWAAMQTTTKKLALGIVEGRWSQIGIDPPLMQPGDRWEVARRAFRDADFDLLTDPRLVAAALEFRLAPSRARHCGGEYTDGEWIAFEPVDDRRERGLLIAHGLAHALLLREQWDHSETDAWLLTAELVAPVRELRRTGVDDVERDAYAPAWFVRGWVSGCAKLGWLPITSFASRAVKSA